MGDTENFKKHTMGRSIIVWPQQALGVVHKIYNAFFPFLHSLTPPVTFGVIYIRLVYSVPQQALPHWVDQYLLPS